MRTASRLSAVAKLIASVAVIAAIVAFCPLQAKAQTGQIAGIGDTTSTPVAGVPHDYLSGLSETVNPANGALSIRIKAPTPHERGVNWPTYAFAYDSDGQYTLIPTWQTVSGSGNEYTELTYLNFSGAIPSSVSGQTQTLQVTLPTGNGTSQTYECQVTNGFVYTDPNGGRHGLGLGVATPVEGGPNACSNFPSAFNQSIGGDEQYKAWISNPGTNPVSVQVVDEHGNLVTGTSSLPEQDVNGNLGGAIIPTVFFPEGPNTDTGRLETVSTSSSGYTLTVPDATTPSGQAAPYVATYATVAAPSEILHFTVANNDYCVMSSISMSNQQYGPAGPLVSSLALPNGQQYQFQYDPTFGLIDKIIYPTGAWVEYTWSVIPNAEGIQYRSAPQQLGGLCAITYDWFAITKRVVSYDGTNADEEQDFSYSTTFPAPGSGNSYEWTSKSTTVVTKDLLKGAQFTTVYNYSPVLPPAESPSAWEDLGYVPEENTIQYYDTNGSLLKTVTKTWQTMSLLSGECVTLPNGSTSGTFYQYQSYAGFNGGVLNPGAKLTDLPTDVAEYDYGQVTTPCVRPAAGTIPVRETETTYATFGTTPLFPYASILDRPSKVQIYGNVSGTQTLEAETDYQYDGAAPTNVSNLYGHDSAYGTTNNVRGNPTQVTRVCTVQSSAPCSYTDSVSSYTYDIAGQVIASKDPNNNTTQYTYSDTAIVGDGAPPSGYVTDAFLSKITEPPVAAGTFTQNFTWGYNDGRMWSKQDENGNTTAFCYQTSGCTGNFDPFFRLTKASYPDGGYENITYNDSRPAVTVTTAINTTGTLVVETKETIYQAMGQDPVETQLQTDPVAIRKVYTYYDGLNRVSQLSNPYWGASDPTYGLTTYTYDALNRTTSLKHPDNTSQTMQYNAESPVINGDVVLFTDEKGNQWQRTSDALGRLTQVLEPNGTSQTPTMETDYTYDALGNLNGVTQWGGPHGTPGAQTRTFVYNGLSELRTSSNPENGNITYTYDANGNVKTKIDGHGTATYGPYDALNRPAGISYSDNVTPPVTFIYDTSTISGNQNTKTRLTSATVMNGSSKFSQVSPYNYDSMGRIQDIEDCLATSATACTNYTLTYAYNQAGNVSSMIDGALSPALTLTSTYDGADQLSLLTSSLNTGNYPGTLFQANSTSQTAPSYGPAGLMNASMGISGSGTLATVNRSYDNRVQVTGETDMEGSNTVYSYSIAPYNKSNPPASGYDAVGNIVSFSDSVMGTWNATYDTLNRIASATAIAGSYSSAALSWTIDPFGNRTAQTVSGHPTPPMPQSWSATVSSTHDNRIVYSSPPGANWTYDAAGDVTSDGANDYLYDGAGRLCAVENLQSGPPYAMTGYLYDGNGNRIAKGSLTSFSCNLTSNGFAKTSSYVVDKDGEQLTELGGSNPHTNVFAGGKLLATYSNSQVYFGFTDWLGTKRAEVASNCSSTYASLPYGDELTPSGNCQDATEHHYTGKERDTESGNDFFLARYYTSTAGRFISPDWSGKAEAVPYADFKDPQSLNLYEYQGNNPLAKADKDGHCDWCDKLLTDVAVKIDTFLTAHPQIGEAMDAAAKSIGIKANLGIGENVHLGSVKLNTNISAYVSSSIDQGTGAGFEGTTAAQLGPVGGGYNATLPVLQDGTFVNPFSNFTHGPSADLEVGSKSGMSTGTGTVDQSEVAVGGTYGEGITGGVQVSTGANQAEAVMQAIGNAIAEESRKFYEELVFSSKCTPSGCEMQ